MVNLTELDEGQFILACEPMVQAGRVLMPGHSCSQEDHHLGMNLEVMVIHIHDKIVKGNCVTVAIPFDSGLGRDLLDGTFAQQVSELRRNFPGETS